MNYEVDQNLPLTAAITNQGSLSVGGCDVLNLAQQYGTPLYILDEVTIRENCRNYLQAFHDNYANTRIAYASKALSTVGIIKIIQEEGLSLDVVSGGELYIALQAGFNPQNIFFHGNNKSPQEIQEALNAQIGFFVVDNLTELKTLNELNSGKSKQKILLRVTPGIEAHTHDFIKTGQFDSKFGFHYETIIEVINEVKKCPNLEFYGLHVHIGSQILETSPFGCMVEKMIELIKKIKDKTKIEIAMLNLGGGLGICYLAKDTPPSMWDYAKIITSELKYLLQKNNLREPELVIEPGRSIVGRAGITLYQVGAIKNIPGIRKYIMLDGGMADNPRPITYQAKYEAVVANKVSAKKTEIVTLAGRFCESGDILIKDILLPPLVLGDILAVLGTGAYNYAMASNYNQVLRPALILVKDGKNKILVRRQTYQDLLNGQEF